MITLSTLAKTVEDCTLNASSTEETLLNALLEPIVSAGRVKAREEKVFRLDKARTSKIINGRCDVPAALRKPLARYGIEDSVADRFDIFIEEQIDPQQLGVLVDRIINLSSGDDELERKLQSASEDAARVLSIALLEAIKNDNRQVSCRRVWSNGTGSFSVEIGDIFAHAFGGNRRIKQIVVIPVESSFGTRVTWDYEHLAKPLISPKTLHGQWLVRMKAAGVDAEELDDRIASNLRIRGIAPIQTQETRQSERAEYPIGTIAILASARTVFFLLVIARLDDNNNAQSTAADVREALACLIRTYDREGQGLDLFVPLLGTGESRANLSHQESYDLITEVVAQNRQRIHGKMTAVIYREDANEVRTGMEE